MEEWKIIPGYEGLYEISSYGRIKSMHYKKERIMKQLDYNGYKKVVLWKNGTQKKEYIHRLVAQAFIPNPDELKEVNHKDENPSNNMVENLEWCNHRYNMIYGTARERARNTAIKNGSWYQNSDEHRKEYYKKWLQDHKEERREYHREYLRKYREENKEYFREYHKRYYQNHKDKWKNKRKEGDE